MALILATWENRRASMVHRKGVTTKRPRTSRLLTHASETVLISAGR